MPKLSIFIDESGKPEVYSSKGVNLVLNGTATKYLVLAVVRVEDQLKLSKLVLDFKQALLQEKTLEDNFTASYSLDAFHARNDIHQVRRAFYKLITQIDIKIDVIVVEKLLCFPALKENPNRMYSVMAGQLLKNVVHKSENVEIIFSRKDNSNKIKKDLQLVVDTVRTGYLAKHPNINHTLNLSYHHNPHYTHAGLQIADYVAYAVFQAFEKQNFEYYEILKAKIGRIHDICNKKYYTRSNPLELPT